MGGSSVKFVGFYLFVGSFQFYQGLTRGQYGFKLKEGMKKRIWIQMEKKKGFI